MAFFGLLTRKKKRGSRNYTDAAAALAAGDHDVAIEMYRKLLTRRPRNAAIWHKKIAEAMTLAGRSEEAVEELLAAARRYEADDLTLQAIAIHKAILRLDPDNQQVREMLGEIAQDENEAERAQSESDEPGQMTIRTRLRRYAPPFSEFDPETLSAVVDVMQTHHMDSGHIVFEQGDAGDSLFIIARGEVALTVKGSDNEPVELERLAENDCFGEVSALSRVPRNVTAVATCQTELLELGRVYLEAVAIAHPQIWSILERFQQRRLIPAGV